MNKRILKTGALAVAATIAFAIFANRVANWGRGFNSETAILQPITGRDLCSTNGMETIKVIPQIVVGSFDGGLTNYSTVIQIVNTSGAAQNITANFYKQDGGALDSVELTAGDDTISNGILRPSSMAKDTMLIVSGGGNTTRGTLGWGRVTACGSLSLSTFYELRDGKKSALYSRVGVPASPANLSTFVIPRIREAPTGLDVGFALVNTGSSDATLTAELKDATGKTIATKEFRMGARTHQSAFTKDVFPPVTESNERSYQYLKFTSPSPTFAAVGLAFEGPTQTSFPVDVLE